MAANPVRPSPDGDSSAGFAIEVHTATDGYAWRYRRFRPTQRPRAYVVGLHGIQSHGGWYVASCGMLRDAGFTVDFIDRRGSGLNDKDRGDAPSFRRLLDDIAEFIEALRKTGDPELPVFLMAISWGGKLAVALERRHPGLVDGLALLCPGFFARVSPPFWQRLAIVATRFVMPRKLFPVPLSDPHLFTASPRWQRYIEEEPLGVRQATARLLVESARLDGYLRFVPKYVRVPVLLMLAQEDRIIRNDKTRRYVERFRSPEKQVIEYAGAGHTLEFEPDPTKHVGDLARWLGALAERPRKP
jgi:alpha-beta hydrolase superfamily lysophospholipase